MFEREAREFFIISHFYALMKSEEYHLYRSLIPQKKNLSKKSTLEPTLNHDENLAHASNTNSKRTQRRGSRSSTRSVQTSSRETSHVNTILYVETSRLGRFGRTDQHDAAKRTSRLVSRTRRSRKGRILLGRRRRNAQSILSR